MEAIQLLAQTAPGKGELVFISLLPTLAGLAAFYFLNRMEPSSLPYRLRLASLIPIVGGALYGAVLSYRMATDFLYQQANMIGSGIKILHYASLVVPILGIIAILVWNGMAGRQQKYDF